MRSLLRTMILVCAVVPSVHASDVWYSDTEGTSKNGRYHATGESPENRKKNPKPFAMNFTFELYDKVAKKRLWQFETGENDEPGGALYVSDQGEVIRMGVYDSLWLIHKTGEQVKLGGVFEHLPKGEVDAYCDDTSVGTFWSQFSWREFIKIEGRNYFFIRTYWGRYITIDLTEGKLVKNKKLLAKIESSILKRSCGVLNVKSSKLWRACSSCGEKHPDSLAARSLLVLELHEVKGREYLIKEFKKLEDHLMHDVVEHVERLRQGRRGARK